MKKVSKLLVIFLAAVLSFGSACSDKKDSSGNSGSTPKNTAEDVKRYDVTENTLHNVNVSFSSPVGEFVKNGKSQYKIFAPSKYLAAANFLKKQIKAGTGYDPETIIDGDINVESGKYIVLGDDTIMDKYNVFMAERSELRSAGYYIKTVGDDVFLGAYTSSGAQLAAIAFLKQVLGYDMLSSDTVVYEKDGSVLPAMTILERPDYEFRLANNKMSDDAAYGMGFTTLNTLLSTTPNGSVHNMFDFFTDEEFAAHPDWFSDGAVKADENLGQPCFTARGNKESYEAFVKFFAEKVKAQIETQPENVVNMRISQNDVTGNNTVAKCTCTACNASFDHYGTTGGAMLAFSNDVAEIINAYMEENHPDRDFHIVLLVYGSAIQAPVKKNGNKYVLDANGKGVPTVRYSFDETGKGTPVKDENGNDELLVFGKNVGCEFAPSGANWLHTFYEEENAAFSGALEAWSGLGGDLYVWAYEMCYPSYFYPYNNYDIIVDNIRYFKQNGGNYIYSEGTWENINAPTFAKFRSYLTAKALFDVNVNYEELKTFFFKNYFKDAAPMMEEFLLKVQLNCETFEKVTGGGVQSRRLATKEVWSQALLCQFMDLIDESYAAIEKYKNTDETLYEALHNHILIESLFPRLALCQLYPDKYSDETIKQMRASFKEDFYLLGNVTHMEHYTAETLFSEWGLN